jgi:FKBP-type peptidyl-prolyl cis-trans isomerase
VLTGLKIVDVMLGEGPIVKRGSRVTVRYTGYLNRSDTFQTYVVISSSAQAHLLLM